MTLLFVLVSRIGKVAVMKISRIQPNHIFRTVPPFKQQAPVWKIITLMMAAPLGPSSAGT
jgi:hypothetical protein